MDNALPQPLVFPNPHANGQILRPTPQHVVQAAQFAQAALLSPAATDAEKAAALVLNQRVQIRAMAQNENDPFAAVLQLVMQPMMQQMHEIQQTQLQTQRQMELVQQQVQLIQETQQHTREDLVDMRNNIALTNNGQAQFDNDRLLALLNHLRIAPHNAQPLVEFPQTILELKNLSSPNINVLRNFYALPGAQNTNVRLRRMQVARHLGIRRPEDIFAQE